MKKKALLIAGGGTIGTYTALELNKLGYEVDIICKDGATLDVSGIKYYISAVTDEILEKRFSEKNITS